MILCNGVNCWVHINRTSSSRMENSLYAKGFLKFIWEQDCWHFQQLYAGICVFKTKHVGLLRSQATQGKTGLLSSNLHPSFMSRGCLTGRGCMWGESNRSVTYWRFQCLPWHFKNYFILLGTTFPDCSVLKHLQVIVLTSPDVMLLPGNMALKRLQVGSGACTEWPTFSSEGRQHNSFTDKEQTLSFLYAWCFWEWDTSHIYRRSSRVPSAVSVWLHLLSFPVRSCYQTPR